MASTVGLVVFFLTILRFMAAQICQSTGSVCKFQLTVEPRLSMMDGKKRVMPKGGGLYYYDDSSKTLLNQTDNIITTDGVYARLVISINGQFPGPELIMYEGQDIEVSITNEMHTDSIAVHFHGIHQRGTPWMDGVAFITQCPILPGSTFIHKFKAIPAGTHWYHAHIGDQRSMGLYGAFIIKKRNPPPSIIDNHIIVLQDWNHDMDPETAYQKMLFGVYDCDEQAQSCSLYKETGTVDGGKFSRFEFHTGLINGRGRYHWGNNADHHNGAPLRTFEVHSGKTYRFRVISAATLYPLRVYVAGHNLTVVASDGRELKQIDVDSFVIQTGERYDFYLKADQPPKDYLIAAESLEVGFEKKHIGEAILRYVNNSVSSFGPPETQERPCTSQKPCRIFNCPHRYYPAAQNKNCLTYNFASGTEDDQDPDRDNILQAINVKRFFLNFAFPGTPGNTPGSVNGRQFVFPKVSALTQPTEVGPLCANEDCGPGKICSCVYSIDIENNDIVELVLLNMGNGSGWSHPVHIHGHSVYVKSYGFPEYNQATAKIIDENDNIECIDSYCNDAKWRGDIRRRRRRAVVPTTSPGRIPPLKDTLIVPTGGYVITRFKADNPGLWFLHCHIDLHNTNGMAMLINESFNSVPKPPQSLPVCGDYLANVLYPGSSTSVTLGQPGSFFILVLTAAAFSVFG